jgi:hypothetical protein
MENSNLVKNNLSRSCLVLSGPILFYPLEAHGWIDNLCRIMTCASTAGKTARTLLTHGNDVSISVAELVVIFGSNSQPWLNELCDVLSLQIQIHEDTKSSNAGIVPARIGVFSAAMAVWTM